jgi:hypothetical protein
VVWGPAAVWARAAVWAPAEEWDQVVAWEVAVAAVKLPLKCSYIMLHWYIFFDFSLIAPDSISAALISKKP